MTTYLTTLLLGKQYVGIEHYSYENKESIAIVKIENTKEGLKIKKKQETTQNKLEDNWDKTLPFVLILNSIHVIQKEILSIDQNDEKLLHKAFPNITKDEFYYEIWRMQSKSIIAISRKSYVQQILDNYREQKVFFAAISLGICALSESINYAPENTLVTNTQIISLIQEAETIQYRTEYSEKSYELNGLIIKSSSILAFSGILRLLINKSTTTGNIINFNHQLLDVYNQKTFFTKNIKIFISFLLSVLLINFFVFNHYYKKVQEASQSLLLNKSSIESIQKVKERIITKEQKLKNTMEFTSSKSSLILNEITEKIPSSIILSELVYNPLEKKIKENEPILINEAVIILSGKTIDNNAFTNWINSLEKLKSINKVVIIHFGKNDTNETVFSVKVNLNKNEIK